MIFLNFLGEKQNRIFNELYELTDGKIILTGSSVLKYHNIIDRNVGNLNVFINKVDLNYFEKNHHIFQLRRMQYQVQHFQIFLLLNLFHL